MAFHPAQWRYREHSLHEPPGLVPAIRVLFYAGRCPARSPEEPNMAETKLRGVIAAVATPVNEDGSPDTARATKLAR